MGRKRKICQGLFSLKSVVLISAESWPLQTVSALQGCVVLALPYCVPSLGPSSSPIKPFLIFFMVGITEELKSWWRVVYAGAADSYNSSVFTQVCFFTNLILQSSLSKLWTKLKDGAAGICVSCQTRAPRSTAFHHSFLKQQHLWRDTYLELAQRESWSWYETEIPKLPSSSRAAEI